MYETHAILAYLESARRTPPHFGETTLREPADDISGPLYHGKATEALRGYGDAHPPQWN